MDKQVTQTSVESQLQEALAELSAAKKRIQQLESQLKSESTNKTQPDASEQFSKQFGGELESVEKAINTYLPDQVRKEVNKIIYGTSSESLELNEQSIQIAEKNDFEIAGYRIGAGKEQLRSPRWVRVGAVQNIYKSETTAPVAQQRERMWNYNKQVLEAAYHSGVNVICFQELWTCPFFVATREKYPWIELSESAENGPTTLMMCELARKYKMVIINSILERDEERGTIFNTAVVISSSGKILGKHRKNHIPRVGDFNESTYYMEGNLGHPVFETEFGRIGVNICYDRHHPLSWQQLALNGAEIVFNPSATVGGLSEPMWAVEARNAAIANHYFAVGLNRVGTETFPNQFTSGDGKEARNNFGHFYGSSYVAAPDASRTPGLSRTRDGLLIAELDLNLCQQTKDKWGFSMTGRYEYYAEKLTQYTQPTFKQHIIRDQQ